MKYIELGKLLRIKTGKLDANKSNPDGQYLFFTCSKEPLRINTYSYDCECVLVAGNGDLNVKYYNGKFDAYQRTYILEVWDNNILNTKYLYFFMEKYIETLRNQAIGGVIKYIKLENIEKARIPIVDLKKQKYVVEILSTLNKIMLFKNDQLKKLNELKESQFIKIFGDPNKNDKNFEIVELSKCVSRIDNGKSFICENYSRSDDYPAILKLSAVTYGDYNQKENKALIDKEQFIPKYKVNREDLLFTRKNTPELVGMSAFVYETEPNLMMPDIIFRINTLDNCNKVYLWQMINHPLFRKKIMSISNGSAKSMSNISKENLLKLKIVLPPIELQNDFAGFIKAVDKQKLEIKDSLDELKTMYDSLTKQFFEI